MSSGTLEERVAALELQVAQLRMSVQPIDKSNLLNWKATFGVFADDSGFDEVLRLGREIRQQEILQDEDHVNP